MNRLNGAKCYIYSKDGRYKGTYTCVIRVEENQIIGELVESPLGNIKKVEITIKSMQESLNDCKLTIFNCDKSQYYVLEDYIVVSSGCNEEDAWIIDNAENITSRIREITKDEYELLKSKGISNIEWGKIKTNFGNKTMTKDKAFEELCVEIINSIKLAPEGNFHSGGGTDGGRDYIWEWPEIENTNLDFLDLPKAKWIMQCKYSSDTEQKLQRPEVWEEIIKVIPYAPNHYIIFTNRKRTQSFDDWWKMASELSYRRKYLIPFSLHIVGREDIERLLNLFPNIKEKYFGTK